MPDYFERYQIRVKPHAWPGVSKWLKTTGAEQLAEAGGQLYGVWGGQIGLGSNEGVVMTVWPDAGQMHAINSPLLDGAPDLLEVQRDRLAATVRPTTTAPPTAPGIYAHRWFLIQETDWPEFLELSQNAWTYFEVPNDIEVVGFWRSLDIGTPKSIVWLMTRYASLATWEGSRVDQAKSENQKEASQRFLRRHELTESTCVVTTRLHR